MTSSRLFVFDTNTLVSAALLENSTSQRALRRALEVGTIVVLRSIKVDVATNVSASRDPDDDKFLELAVDGRVDAIVSGDQDLLALDPFREIPIYLVTSPQQKQPEGGLYSALKWANKELGGRDTQERMHRFVTFIGAPPPEPRWAR